eukprot:g3584.t1
MSQKISKKTSMGLVKNLFRLSVSTVCYLRNIFDDNLFQDIDHGCGTKIKRLSVSKCDSSTPRMREAKRLMEWLETGVFDAMSKQYLRSMVFSIYQGSSDEDPSKLVECYMYRIAYPSPGEVRIEGMEGVVGSGGKTRRTGSHAIDGHQLRAQAIHMIRSLIALCSSFSPLPDSRTISMTLFYNDDITPPDYEPPCFKALMPGEEIHFKNKAFLSQALSLHLGDVTSKFHSVSMKVKALEENVDGKSSSPRDASVVSESDAMSVGLEELDTKSCNSDVKDDAPSQDDFPMSQKHREDDLTFRTTQDSERRVDEAFDELPPWRRSCDNDRTKKDTIQRQRAIALVLGSADFAKTKIVTETQLCDAMSIPIDEATSLLDYMTEQKLLGPKRKRTKGRRIIRNTHSKMECKIAKSALQNAARHNENLVAESDLEATQIEADQLHDFEEAARKARDYRSYGISSKQNSAPFLRKAPSPRRVLQGKKHNERTLPTNANVMRKRVHGADWLRESRKLHNISNSAFESDTESQVKRKEDAEDDAAFEFSQDSIFNALTKRKSSTVSRPIHQYGRKKKRRRNRLEKCAP